jgi:hypothetical protein
MREYKQRGMLTDPQQRMSYMKTILIQVREDHHNLNRQWKELVQTPTDASKVEELIGTLSWLKEGLEVIHELTKDEIEGVQWGEIKYIKKDIRIKEEELRRLLFSIIRERVNSHLR